MLNQHISSENSDTVKSTMFIQGCLHCLFKAKVVHEVDSSKERAHDEAEGSLFSGVKDRDIGCGNPIGGTNEAPVMN